ncbi:hypothetical protein LMG7974_01463 [Campylobacter majalis]|uniref:Aminoglycoside N(3)-acetyltransferase n=1 Tax=Campylobacter majalis TaxID=2790656 RepID=A0ABM8Q8R4_9BACT|nr:AAC(3) family N-acetyltransferase [Campylobacter majalis]CAD7289345.1 hypothetical protein LMG7974_01463 [Campylobacter majalis]
MIDIFEYNGIKFNNKELKDVILECGISSADMVCVHSDFTKFGKILQSKDIFLQAIQDTLLSIIKQDGTLIIPTFTYSFCNSEIYNKKISTCKVGALGEYFRFKKGVYRTNDPIFSHAIFGRKIDEFKHDFTQCFGKNSAFDVMYKNNAKIVLLGCGKKAFSYAMFIEQAHCVSYRYLKKFSGVMIDEMGISSKKDIWYFVRNLDINPIPDTTKRMNVLMQSGAAKKVKFAGSDIYIIDAKAAYETIGEKLKKDDRYFLK